MFNKRIELKKMLSVIMIFCLLFQNLIYAYVVEGDENSVKLDEAVTETSLVSGAGGNQNVDASIESETKENDETDIAYETRNETETTSTENDSKEATKNANENFGVNNAVEVDKDIVDIKETSDIKSVDDGSILKGDGIYQLTNPTTNVEMIVNGRGKVLLKAIDKDNEMVDVLKDKITDDSNFMYKVIQGEEVEESSYEIDGEKYVDKYPASRTEFYDKNGVKINVPNDKLKNVFGAYFTIGDNIFYYTRKDSVSSKIQMLDTKDLSIYSPSLYVLEYVNGKIILSTESYGDATNQNRVIYIYDDVDVAIKDLKVDSYTNATKKIEGYSYLNNWSSSGKTIYTMNKKVTVNGEDTYAYNMLDDNFEKIFDDDIYFLTTNYEDNNILEYEKNDMKYTYTIATGDIKEVGPKEENKYINNQDVYATYSDAIKNKVENCNYVEIEVYKDKPLFFAMITLNDSTGETRTEVYDINLKKVREFESFNFVDAEMGRIFVNNGDVYDFDFNLLTQFKKDTMVTSFKKYDKMFYMDRYDKDFNNREEFTLYDEDFRPLFTATAVDNWVFDDYIVVNTENETFLYDKNLDIYKKYDRNIEIGYAFNDAKYRKFRDVNANREGVLDENLNIIIDNLKKVTNVENNKYFIYQKGFKYGFMDFDGNVLLSFSIFDTFDDGVYRPIKEEEWY